MATIWWEETVAVPAARAWDTLRRVDKAHELFAPVLVDGAMEGDIRIVTFANGLGVRERIVTIDEHRRRVAYTVLGDMFEHHSASMQIVPVDAQTCRFIWISDVLPDKQAETIEPLVKEGALALVRNLEGRSPPVEARPI